MRSPVLAFSIIAATVSPSLIGAAPTGPAAPSLEPVENTIGTVTRTAGAVHAPRQLPSAPSVPAVPSAPSPSDPLGILHTVTGGSSDPKSHGAGNHATTSNKSKAPTLPEKRASDAGTAGGNAHTGGANVASGGSVENISSDNTAPQAATMSNFGGLGAISQSGNAQGGSGDGFGPGGNAYSGDSAAARGGNVINEGAGGVTSAGPANTVGAGGFSGTGSATGGDATSFQRRALDSQTAGGNAHSGNSASTTSGSVDNVGQEGSTITNTGMSNQAPDVAITDGVPTSESFTGTAQGGNGGDFGPGGNAYSGSAGPSNGGYVYNSGGSIMNTSSNGAANGGLSDSGDATGGDVNSGVGAAPGLPPRKRAIDQATAGGNAYSGATGNTNGGDITNEAGSTDTITNTGGNVAGTAGGSNTGSAMGGNGDSIGPGGNAYSGYSGPSAGGNVFNSAGTVDNTAMANTAGSGDVSMTGDATGGDAGGNFVGPGTVPRR